VRPRLINRRQQGDLGEASAIEWLTRQGATVLIPFGHSPDYDLVAEIEGQLLRIQVKTSTFARSSRRHDRWTVQVATNGGNQTWTGVAKRFNPGAVDYLYILVGDGRRWWIPTSDIDGETNITLGGSKYSEFEISSGASILELVYRTEDPTLKSGGALGEYRSGQPGCAVNALAYAFAGSNPASPTRPELADSGTGVAAQTRVSANHQITIPMRAFEAAELEVGDRLRVIVEGRGRAVLERIDRP
jgi:PD-(D/E)XK endonuclease